MNAALVTRFAQQLGLSPVPLVLSSVSSTNDTAKMIGLEGAPHGTSVFADHQTAGRGRLGRTWVSVAGQNVYASLVLRPSIPVERLPLVCLAAAVAAARVCGPAFRIKWPNDIVDGRHQKVAGILAEVEHSGTSRFVVLGVGIDVGERPEGMNAVSLASHGDLRPREQIAVELVSAILEQVERLESSAASVLDDWRARSATLGARVCVGNVSGVAVDIDESGALLVSQPDQTIARVLAGDVSMIC